LFITVCAFDRGLNTFCHPDIGKSILESISWRNQQQRWFCELAVLMPDHIHVIVQFRDEPKIDRAIHDWKGWLAKTHGIRWQPDFFDHRLRKGESARAKGDYILENPVRAGLVRRAEDWPYFWKCSA
jgi:REP element-mobilizing transposase RayT